MELTLSNVLVYLSGVGVVAVVSWLFEEWAWYQSLIGRTKQLVFFGACLVIAFAAMAVNTYVDPAVLEQIAPWFATAAAIFVNVFLGTSFHKQTKI